MASIRRKPGTRYLYACFTDGEGIQQQRSTKSTDRKFALAQAEAYEAAYRLRQTEFQIRKVMSDIHEDMHGRPLANTTLETYSADWSARVKGEVEDATYSAYKTALRDFEAFAIEEKLWKRPMHNVAKVDVEKFRGRCAAKSSARTANNKLKILRIFFGAAWNDGVIVDNPAKKVKVLKAEKSIRRGFTMDELFRLLSAADEEWRGIIITAFYVGPRIKDIALLTTRKIDLEREIIKFQTSKTDRFMSVPIAKPLLKWLRSHWPKGDNTPLFPRAFKIVERTGKAAQLSTAFNYLMVKAKLADPRPPKDKATGVGRDGARKRSELVFHSLRHTITSQLKMKNVPEAVAMDIVGHDSEAVSAEYTHVDDASKRDALDKLPDITG